MITAGLIMRSCGLAVRICRRTSRVFLFVGLLALPLVSQAIESIGIVLAEDSSGYREVADTIRRILDQEAPGRCRVSVATAESLTGHAGEALKSESGLIVTVGAAAATAVAETEPKGRVLHTLIPRLVSEKLQALRGPGGEGRAMSAVYLDQPPARIMELVRLVVPKSSRVGVIFGPDSAASAKPYENAARQLGLTLESEAIATAEAIPHALERILSRSDLLLAVPDPQVYSPSTLQSILLAAYRANAPVIGLSSAYVRAGALAAVYSTPEQVGRQAAELILKLGPNSRWQLPPPQGPRYFSVEVNRNVARSLGLTLEEETVLTERLKRSGGSES